MESCRSVNSLLIERYSSDPEAAELSEDPLPVLELVGFLLPPVVPSVSPAPDCIDKNRDQEIISQ
jgi:hypothetical protein